MSLSPQHVDTVSAAGGGAALESGSLKRILLVDDEAHVLRVMRLALDRNGYEVDTALDDEVALRMLGERRYQVMIIDSGLGDGAAGERLCRTVRERHAGDAPLMLLTAGESELPARELADSVERVEKPLSLRWIVARLNEYFGDYERGR